MSNPDLQCLALLLKSRECKSIRAHSSSAWEIEGHYQEAVEIEMDLLKADESDFAESPSSAVSLIAAFGNLFSDG